MSQAKKGDRVMSRERGTGTVIQDQYPGGFWVAVRWDEAYPPLAEETTVVASWRLTEEKGVDA